jgi:hypothetical protein
MPFAMQKAACHATTAASAQARRRHNTTIAPPPRSSPDPMVPDTCVTRDARLFRRGAPLHQACAEVVQCRLPHPEVGGFFP